MMFKSVKMIAVLGLAAVTTLAVCDTSEAGRRHRRHYNNCCGNGYDYGYGYGYGYNNYGYGYNNGWSSGCGNVVDPCNNGCPVQQPACGACGSTTMYPAQQTGYEYSAARPTYSDQYNQSLQGGALQMDRDQYIRDQRLNNPAVRDLSDDQIWEQRTMQRTDNTFRQNRNDLRRDIREDRNDLQQDVRQEQRDLRQDQRQLNRDVNQNVRDANQQIQRNVDQNLQDADRAIEQNVEPNIPDAAVPAVE